MANKQKLNEINKQLETARRKKAEAFDKGDAKGLQVYTQEINRLERQAARMQTRAQTVENTLRNLDRATPKDMKTTIREINKELDSGRIQRGSEGEA